MAHNNDSNFWMFDDFEKIFSSFNLDALMHKPIIAQSSVEKIADGSTITVYVPGHNKETLDIEVSDTTITIKSIKDKLPKNVNTLIKSYKFNSEQYDSYNASAECKDGILTIVLPFKKKEEIKSNKITIK